MLKWAQGLGFGECLLLMDEQWWRRSEGWGAGEGYLGFGVLSPQAGRAQLHHLGQFGDGGDGGLRRLSQLLLTCPRPRHQQLGVLHQGFGRLQYVLPKRGEADVLERNE